MALRTLSAVDYILLIMLLLSSAVIGAVFGFFKSKKSSAKEFLLADGGMGSIGAKNMLKSAAKYREFEKQQLQSLIKEKVVELERLRAEYESLQKTEREQNEKMEQLSLKAA
ncbi:unnamed protein product [Rotaria sp. Silwood1]|nr:unnamed protein product [Rotaria sp. Silwood1]